MSVNMNIYDELVDKGYVTKRKHPTQPLWILNYTAKCQIEGYWNKQTLAARGLIVDEQGLIVSRPFPKFFNLDELSTWRNHLWYWYKVRYSEIWNMRFTAYEKMDGSLGVLYRDPKFRWGISTRGSFESEQAQHATELLNTKYANVLSQFNPNLTYLFEIIYPENRIVVDYENLDDLVLLAVVDKHTGRDLPLQHFKDLPFRQPKQYPDYVALDQLGQHDQDNFEGFVVLFENGMRAKVKLDQYKRLHKIMTGVTPKRVLEVLKTGLPLDSWLEGVPDEFYRDVEAIALTFKGTYDTIERIAKRDFDEVMREKPASRKDIALKFKTKRFPQVLFLMLDSKDYSKIIWTLVEEDSNERQ